MNNANIKLRILVDNETRDGLIAEHGFSLLIEVDGEKILFDTGQTNALFLNAEQLGVTLEELDILVLSHGHYDHTGGLPRLLRISHNVRVYCHAAAFLPRYSIKNGFSEPVGMSAEAMRAINALPEERIHWVTKSIKLTKHIGITGEIPRINDFETTGGPFYLDLDGRRTDSIKDDLALWIETPKGLVLCVGCCHAGIANTIDYIQKITGNTRIHTILGGLHLVNADEKQILKTVEVTKKMKIHKLIPCHCTGKTACNIFSRELETTQGFSGFTMIL